MYKIIAIVGPTASGKTSLAIDIANRDKAEIISFDSRQFFSEMNIGTAKPSTEELDAVPHHLIGHISVEKRYNIGEFEKEALSVIEQLHSHSKNIVLVGGSGLYLRALEQGLDTFEEIDPSVRSQIQAQYELQGISYLQQNLQILDPQYYAKVDIHNPSRLIRALEMCIGTGRPYSSFLGKTSIKRAFEIQKIGISIPREELYDRINHRVDRMIEQGLEGEVRGLLPFRACNALQTVAYREFFDYFDGKISREQAIELIKQNTRRYAKRQMTWFSKDKSIDWQSL